MIERISLPELLQAMQWIALGITMLGSVVFTLGTRVDLLHQLSSSYTAKEHPSKVQGERCNTLLLCTPCVVAVWRSVRLPPMHAPEQHLAPMLAA